MKKLLIVDSVHENLILYKHMLKDEFQLFLMDSSYGIEKAAEKFKPDAVLLDVYMPKTDGFGICIKFKKNNLLNNMPIIMISGSDKPEIVVKAFELGAYDFIKQPLNKVEFVARIKSALKKYEEKELYERLSLTDNLTGLYNRKFLEETLQETVVTNLRKKRGFAFLLMDVDYFKHINDTYGHPAGDSLLKEVALILKSIVRGCDCVARFGGDEFAIILNEVDKIGAEILCKRLVKKVDEYEFIFFENKMTVSISIGIMVIEPNGNISKNQIIKRADEALYQAKKEGRNRFVSYTY